MKQRFFERFYWSDRQNTVNTKLALFLGNKLLNGYSVAQALEKASKEIDNNFQKNALSNASYMIDTGSDIGDALYSSRVKLSKKDGYVLSLPIPSVQKGKILKSWSESRYNGSNSFNYCFICFCIIYFCLFSLPIFPFVLPQFREIMYGMSLDTNNNLKNYLFFLDNPDFFIFVLVALLLIVVSILVISYFFNKLEKMQEESDLIAALSSVSQDEQLRLLDFIINDICFPKSYKKFLRIINSLKYGENFQDSIFYAGVSPYFGWLLQLSMFDKDRTALKEGSDLINERIALYALSSVKIIEIVVVILESLVFLLVAFVLYGSINGILLGSMGIP